MQLKRRYMLTEIYYDQELNQNTVEIIKERKHLCLQNLLKSRTLEELTNNDSIEIIELEQLNSMIISDTKVYVKVDLLYKRDYETWVIVDWKTGKEDKHIKDQLHLMPCMSKKNTMCR